MSKQAMSKQAESSGQAELGVVYCGVDVGASELVAAAWVGEVLRRKVFANSTVGHRGLIAWLDRMGDSARVSLEATGVYSVDLALGLDAAEGIEVAVLNPKRVHRFAETMRRSKTDQADAEMLAEYSRRMPFEPWQRPSLEAMRLRAVMRHVAGLNQERTRKRNQMHAAQGSQATPRCVLDNLRRSLVRLDREMLKMRRAARELVQGEPEMERRFRLLITIPGIAELSALDLLAELAPLASEMTARQWVAHSGLDPKHEVSGSSVRKPSRISRAGNRQLRRALFMPALVAARRDLHFRAFYQSLIDRHKAKLQALVAVARKMLHAIHGIFEHGSAYDGAKLFPKLIPAS